MATPPKDYFRRDRKSGITSPDLRKTVTFAEHIVHARGKRTQLTSVSLDPTRIMDFGESLYQARAPEIKADGHEIVDHNDLMISLRQTALDTNKEERVRAIQALRYAKRRLECLVRWNFDISAVDPKDAINWAYPKVQLYFMKK